MIKIDGIDAKTLNDLQNTYNNRVIASSLWNDDDEWYSIILNDNAIIKVNTGEITIDLGAVLYTLKRYDYVSALVV